MAKLYLAARGVVCRCAALLPTGLRRAGTVVVTVRWLGGGAGAFLWPDWRALDGTRLLRLSLTYMHVNGMAGDVMFEC